MKTIIVLTPAELQGSKWRKFIIEIRMDDPCKNGHNAFAITASAWSRRKRTTELDCFGCMHNDILKLRPDLKEFVDLHSSREDGTPMYALENGFYFDQIARGVAKHHKYEIGDEVKWRNVCINHLRISDSEMNDLSMEMTRVDGEDNKKIVFASYITKLQPRWKVEADNAIARLKEMSSIQ